MLTRRRMTALSFAFLGASGFARKSAPDFSKLETRLGGHIGLCAIDLRSGQMITHRPDERFAMCSTFKSALAASVLQRADNNVIDLDDRVTFSEDDLLPVSRVTQAAGGGLSIRELCAAAVEHSDNTAANLLLDLTGGPGAMTEFFRSLGDETTRLDRMELELNSNLPGDLRDTTTPRAMAQSLSAILTDPSVLSESSRRTLIRWMDNEQNGKRRIRAGAPEGWAVGDKPGTSINGAVNDIAYARRPDDAEFILTIYTNAPGTKISQSEIVIAETAKLVFSSVAP